MARNVDIGRRKSVQGELFVCFSYHLIDIKGFFCIKNYYFVVQAGLKCSKYCTTKEIIKSYITVLPQKDSDYHIPIF